MTLLFIDVQESLELLIEKIQGWFNLIILKAPDVLLAALIFAFFLLIAKTLNGLIRRGLNKITTNQMVNKIAGGTIYYLIMVLGFLEALNVLGLQKTVVSILAGAGIIGLALSFAFQNIASNFISGIIIAFRRPYNEGDWIKTNEVYGFVIKTSINFTKIQTENGQVVFMPNKDVLEHPVFNYSRLGLREVELHMMVPYDADLKVVMEQTKKAVEDVPSKVADRPFELYYKNFSEFAIDMEITFWINFSEQKDYDQASSEAVSRIIGSLQEKGISVEVPKRKVEFKEVRG